MPPIQLLRMSAYAGFISTTILLLNLGRRSGVVPDTALTRGIAPLGAILAIVLLVGLYLQRHEHLGRLGAAALALNVVGVAMAGGLEAILNWTFPYLTDAQVGQLLDGPTAHAFLGASLVFLAGTWTFAVALWRAHAYSTIAVGLYALGLTPVALRGVVPLPVFLTGLAVAAVGTGFLSRELLEASGDSAGVRAPAGAGVRP